MNRHWPTAVVLVAVVLTARAGFAQDSGFGIGPRLTFVRGSADLPDGTQRFSGGAMRFRGARTALELAMDIRSGVSGDLTERVKDYPFQASMLIYPFRAKVSPYVLGGIGWYTQRVERLSGSQTVLDGQTTRKRGYHAGFGGELRVHRHLGVYGDYRYTFIHFGDSEPTASTGNSSQTSSSEGPLPRWIPYADRLKMSHQGSMMAWGATLYF